jgi:O-antigen/teichoic acid export membrane protein
MANQTARQAAQMSALRFIGLGIGAAAQIYAARQLGPEKLGISGMALAAVAQGGLLVTWGANTLLIREYKEAQTNEERQSLISAAYTMRTLITAGLAIVLLGSLPLLWSHPQYLLAATCILPVIFFESNQALWILQAKEKVPAQYLANMVSAMVSAFFIFIFVKPSSPPGCDILASLIGLIVAFFISWFLAVGRMPGFTLNKVYLKRITFGAKWLFATSLINYGYNKIDQPLVGLLSSIEELGKYRTGSQVVAAILPLTTIVSLLIYPRLIQAAKISPLAMWQQQRIYLQLLGPIVILLIAGTLLAAPLLYPIIYGAAYQDAAIPCAFLISAKFVVVLNGVLVGGLWAMKKDREVFLLMSITALSSLLLNVFFIPRFGMIIAASVQFASECLVLVLAYLLCRSVSTFSGLDRQV